MLWAPILSFVAMCCAGAHSQPVLTQPPSASVSPGNTVRLSCAFSSGVSVSNYYVNWYQQKPGSPPRFLLWYYSDSSKGQGSGVPARFSGSKDTSTNSGILTISGVQAEDEADYYCGAGHGSGNASQYIFGSGTQLTITGQDPVTPKVSVYPPSNDEIATQQKATSVCLMSDFRPSQIRVEWQCDGKQISTGVDTSKPTKKGQNYVASSYLTQTAQEWQSRNACTCKVTHGDQVIEKTVRRT